VTVTWAHQVSHSRLRPPHFCGPLAVFIHRPPSPAELAPNGFILPQASRLYRVLPSSHPPRTRKSGNAFLGVHLRPHRDISHPRRCGEIPTSSPLRPRRFSRPRRLCPRTTLWVCFAPQPRPGFTLQGLSLQCSRIASSATRALSSLSPVRYQQLPTSAAFRGLALRALFHTGIRCQRDGG